MSDEGKQKSVLLTLGRLPVALDIARSFSKAGWRVIVAEPFGMHLTRMSRSVTRCYRTCAPRHNRTHYLNDLRRIIANEHITLVVPVSEESMHVSALKGELEGVEVFSMPQPHLLELHDKLLFNRLAARLGLSVPMSFANDESSTQVTEAGDYVIKPRMGCSGRGVLYRQKGHRGQIPQDTLVQQKISGCEFSSFSIAHSGKVFCTAVYAARATSGSVSVVFERIVKHEALEAMERWVQAFVGETQHTGFIAFDFMVNREGVPYALECNPRATSGIHFIKTAQLADAISQTGGSLTEFRSERLLQESYSSFTAALGAVRRPDERRRRFGLLRSARDISWSREDPWPFLLMTINTYRLIGLSVLRGMTFAEVAALDIEWTRV